MPDLATRDITTRDIATRDVGTADIGAAGTTLVYDWGGLSLVASTGGNVTPPSIGDSDGNRLVRDWENRFIPVKAEETRVFGARRVENLVDYSEDLTASGNWTEGVNATIDSATEGTLPNSSALLAYTHTEPIAAGSTFVFRAKLSGNGIITVRTGSYGTESRSEVRMTLDGTKRLYSFSHTYSVAHSSFVVNFVKNVAGDTLTSITIEEYQIEDVTGQTNQNPSEYVSTGVVSDHGWGVDGVKYFSTENGNTVSSNVVTEATGTALTTIKGYTAEGAATELSGYSGDLDNAAWSKVNGATATKDAVGLSGASNEAFTITDSSGSYGYIAKATTITSSSSTYYAVLE